MFSAILSAKLITGQYKPLRQSAGTKFSLEDDPQCGLIRGGVGCALDCDALIYEYSEPFFSYSYPYYRDPTCLDDCIHYPECVRLLVEDFKTKGRVDISDLLYYAGGVSNQMCNIVLLLPLQVDHVVRAEPHGDVHLDLRHRAHHGAAQTITYYSTLQKMLVFQPRRCLFEVCKSLELSS